jgi:3-hydroxybutyryl-CoA dehydrogenase
MFYYCENCDKWWNYNVKKCIFCGNDLLEVIETKYEVIGSTRVNVPSDDNKKVPYFNYLLENESGNKIIIKSFEDHQIGDIIDLKNENSNKNCYTVGIVGTGQMGLGIAEYILRHGHKTIIKTRNDTENVIARIEKKLLKDNTESEVSNYLNNLIVTIDISKFSECDIIIEAIPENINLKKSLFQEISHVCNLNTIFATNTSSISINELAKITDRPDKFIGMHFFNPVSKMDLIEVVIGEKTSKKTAEWVINFSIELNKIPVNVMNSPGFIVNRLLLPQINEAVHLIEKNIAEKEDIDKAMKMGLNHPMGPFQLADFIGIDICVSILETIHDELKDDKFKPADTLIKMVENGKLGFKSGEGFYKY